MISIEPTYRYLIPFLWIMVGNLFPLFAQIDYIQPAQFLENSTLLNPAYAGQFSKQELNTHYISFSGIREAYKTLYFNGYTQLPDKKVILGGTILADIDQDFSQLIQTKFLFTYQLFKTNHQTLQAGGEFGALNYYLQATPYTPALSRWNINGNYGIYYQYKAWNMGFSLNNLFQAKIKTLDSELYFYRYLSALTQYEGNINPQIAYKMGLIFQWREVLDNVLRIENQWVFYEKYFLSHTLLNTDLLFLGGGLKEWEIGNRKMKIEFMYALPLSNKKLQHTNQYEIGLKYYSK